MKALLIFSILFFPFITHAKSKVSIQQQCQHETTALYVADGDFVQEKNFRLPKNLTKESFISYTQDQFTDELEKEVVLNILTKIFNKIELGQRSKLRLITEDDLLFDFTNECDYKALIEYTEDHQFLVSSSFDTLSHQEQLYYILEASNFPLTPNYSEVGNRFYAYNLLDSLFVKKPEKEKVEIKKYAGNTIFYKDNVQIDLHKIKLFYNTGAISIASLIKESPIKTPAGTCHSSDIRPVKFQEDGTLSVFTVSRPCNLNIGGRKYITRKNSVVQQKNYGLFINEPMPMHISSIYVPPGFTIKNKDVELIASSDPNKKSKLHFADDASGNIIAYTQFLGMVNYKNNFYKIKDYYNLAKQYKSNFITMMTLVEEITVKQAGFNNNFSGLIRLNRFGEILDATIYGKKPKFMIQGKKVLVMPGSDVSFFFNKTSRVSYMTLGETTKLLTADGTYQIFGKGQRLNFTINGIVK